MTTIISGNFQQQDEAQRALSDLAGAGFAAGLTTTFFVNPPGQHDRYPIGDEFLYLMLEVKEKSDAANAAAKIIESISQPCEFEGLSLTVEPSIGIALYPQNGKSANALLKNADSAMYKAKQSETGYAFFYTAQPA